MVLQVRLGNVKDGIPCIETLGHECFQVLGQTQSRQPIPEFAHVGRMATGYCNRLLVVLCVCYKHLIVGRWCGVVNPSGGGARPKAENGFSGPTGSIKPRSGDSYVCQTSVGAVEREYGYTERAN